MSENNLFQFAQVIAELPGNSSSHQQQIQLQQQQQQIQRQNNMNNYHKRYLPLRKNACVVCSVCFTCSKFYGVDCTCQELQPRRGKNLPEGGLDSRAKKLHPQDPEDFEFSINWINLHAHAMYKNDNNEIEGLRELTEVSLCKAHSSTLYRAKKRHERDKQPDAPPSPADSDPYPSISSGGLAAKVREISSNQYPQQQALPDFNRMSHSTSMKRKRTTTSYQTEPPSSSISTPLYSNTRVNPFMQQQQYQQVMDNFPSQLPPLQQQRQQQQQDDIYPTTSESSPRPTFLLPKQELEPIPMVIETVSLKSSESSMYYFRNLAITDTFTFRDLLNEIDMIGSPPPGKRIVISDHEKFYPLDQPIRHVIQRPASTHLELSLGLTDKPSINWSKYM